MKIGMEQTIDTKTKKVVFTNYYYVLEDCVRIIRGSSQRCRTLHLINEPTEEEKNNVSLRRYHFI